MFECYGPILDGVAIYMGKSLLLVIINGPNFIYEENTYLRVKYKLKRLEIQVLSWSIENETVDLATITFMLYKVINP